VAILTQPRTETQARAIIAPKGIIIAPDQASAELVEERVLRFIPAHCRERMDGGAWLACWPFARTALFILEDACPRARREFATDYLAAVALFRAEVPVEPEGRAA
jgi:hypothetical protein